MNITQRYNAEAVAANGSLSITGDSVYGFICVTAGTITITRSDGSTALNAFPVAAGSLYPLSIYLGGTGGTVTLAGGASGTVLK